MKTIEQLRNLTGLEIKENINLAAYTTYHINGVAKAIIYPKSVEDLQKLIGFLKAQDENFFVIGKGSNIVIVEDYFDVFLISLEKFADVKITDEVVNVSAGYSLIKLSYLLARQGLVGFEFTAGIPGTIGGAIYMNAGAYGSEISDFVDKVIILDCHKMEVLEFSKKQLKFAYRSSILQNKRHYICLSVKLKLSQGNSEEALALIEDRKKRRWSSQPLDMPSAGSVFRNPENDYAGRLIEELGLKGKKIGDAMISPKHANFIVNTGNASGNDIKKLIELVREEVLKEYSITLEVEQEFIE